MVITVGWVFLEVEVTGLTMRSCGCRVCAHKGA